MQWPGWNWEWIHQPSTAWEHGGPIIERAKIDLNAGAPCCALSRYKGNVDELPTALREGSTLFADAMRAYVAS